MLQMRDNRLRITLKDHLEHPMFSWPDTLLNYRVDFSGAPEIMPDGLVLTKGEEETPIPHQLSEIVLDEAGKYLKAAVVSFISDMPGGAERIYTLKKKTQGDRAPSSAVSVEEDRDAVTLSDGRLSLRVPKNIDYPKNPPGPVTRVCISGKWMGASEFCSREKVERVVSETLEKGPVFIKHRVVYTLADKAVYSCEITLAKDMDFFRMYERMEGFDRGGENYVKFVWKDFNPTHRQFPNHPMAVTAWKKPTDVVYEKIDYKINNALHLGIYPAFAEDGEMSISLAVYSPWVDFVSGNTGLFWDEREDVSAGIFIDRAEDWKDGDYAIWRSSTALRVKYYYLNGSLWWKYPISTGARSTCTAVYPHEMDRRMLSEYTAACEQFRGRYNFRNFSAVSYIQRLQIFNNLLSLDRVKDWTLKIPDSAKRQPVIFSEGLVEDPAQVFEKLHGLFTICDMPYRGDRQGDGSSVVYLRAVHEWALVAYNMLSGAMTDIQRGKTEAMLLLLAYIAGSEEYMPMINMLSGHPNFLSDAKSIPAMMVFLFPEHPDAAEWADMFEKFLVLNMRYHSRPDVTRWDASGGRWTENLGCYVWPHMRPAIHAAWLLWKFFDGKNRMALPNIAKTTNWLVQALSCPVYSGLGREDRHYFGNDPNETRTRRVHPPQGAHSSRRLPEHTLRLMGEMLFSYDPLIAEYTCWAMDFDYKERGEKTGKEPDPWRVIFDNLPRNSGTNPHLKSVKMTGYGVTLRAAVDTPEEVYLHVQQLDEGPNYRWGMQSEGGCGVMYYFADGKAYSHNGSEDIGDRPVNDGDFACLFTVYKNGCYRGIGRGDLTGLFADLGPVQFAEFFPKSVENPYSGRNHRIGPLQYAEYLPQSVDSSYSWPEYKFKNVLMIRDDYAVDFDAVYSHAVPHRFSWFTHAKENFPYIHIMSGGSKLTELNNGELQGRWYDGFGKFLAIITHKELSAAPAEKGCVVRSGGYTDRVFINDEEFEITEGDLAFTGRIGVCGINGESVSLALVYSSYISRGEFAIRVIEGDTAIQLTFSEGRASGHYVSREGAKISVSGSFTDKSHAYVSGRERGVPMDISIPKGRGTLQITDALPVPEIPEITGIVYIPGGAEITLDVRGENSGFNIELSSDGGKTWRVHGKTEKKSYILNGLEKGKYHVRASAYNDEQCGKPCGEMPVYVTNTAPHHPDGLSLKISDGTVEASWGKVLGAKEYKLYARKKGDGEYKAVYQGSERHRVIKLDGVVSAPDEPLKKKDAAIYELAVSALDGSGEGNLSVAVNTDPGSWLNWDPAPSEPFRRSGYLSEGNYYPS